MAQKIIQIQMRHLYFNLKDLFSNRKGFVILTSLLRFKNKSREFREQFAISNLRRFNGFDPNVTQFVQKAFINTI